MASLKSDLDQYLLQNETRKSYKISLPFSTPTFFSRNNDETPSSSNSAGTWFEEVQKDYCTLSRTQRFMGFGACLFLGIICFSLSFLYIPLLVLKAKKFVLLSTLGSLFLLFSFSFLYGPWNHIKSMFSRERALPTSLYLFTLIATLYAALHLQSTAWTIVCAVFQVIALLWMMLGSVPGGATGARFFGSIFKSSIAQRKMRLQTARFCSEEALTCNVCDRFFPSRRQLADHQQKKRHFGCSACDSLFPSLMALEHHKEEFEHWSDSWCSRSSSDDSEAECVEDRHRLL